MAGKFDSGDMLSRMFGGGASGGLAGLFGGGSSGKSGWEGKPAAREDWGKKGAKEDWIAQEKQASVGDDLAAAKKVAIEKAAAAKGYAQETYAGAQQRYQQGGLGAAADYVAGQAGLKNPVGAGIAGAAVGGLLSRYGGTALRLGGLALIGGLAYAAWRRYRGAGQPDAAAPAPAANAPAAAAPAAPVQAPPANSGFAAPATADGQQQLGVVLIRSMIQAAKADGQIDAAEMQKIGGEMGTQRLSDAEKAFLMEEMGRPVDLPGLAAQAGTPEVATQVYAAAAIVIGAQSPQEAQYLQSLAQALRLDAGLVQALHQQIEASAPPPLPAAG